MLSLPAFRENLKRNGRGHPSPPRPLSSFEEISSTASAVPYRPSPQLRPLPLPAASPEQCWRGRSLQKRPYSGPPLEFPIFSVRSSRSFREYPCFLSGTFAHSRD